MTTAPKLRRIRKMWQQGLRSLPLLDGRRKREELVPLKVLPTGLNTQFDTTDDEEIELARALRDDALARRINRLKKKYPYATVIERMVVDYLDKTSESYYFMAAVNGGFRRGGVEADFVLRRSGVAIMPNGDYWHRTGGPQNDESDKKVLLGSYAQGVKITKVVIVWERRLMASDRENVLRDAVQGIERGP